MTLQAFLITLTLVGMGVSISYWFIRRCLENYFEWHYVVPISFIREQKQFLADAEALFNRYEYVLNELNEKIKSLQKDDE